MKKKNSALPGPAAGILSLIIPFDFRIERQGDLEEAYVEYREEYSPFRAGMWIWFQIFRLTCGRLKAHLTWGGIMFKNYLKIYLRVIRQHKEYSIINIAGLVMGMACCILILLWVRDELSYDGFHEHGDLLYRIAEEQNYGGNRQLCARTPEPLGAALVDKLPEVEKSMAYFPAPSLLVSYKDNGFYENGIIFADPSIFDMFTFPFVDRRSHAALNDPSSIVLTRDTAEKYFPNEDPINKTLKFNGTHDFSVTGVMENIPANSHLKFDIILPLQALEKMGKDAGLPFKPVLGRWGTNFLFTYIQVREKTGTPDLNRKIRDFIRENSSITAVSLFAQPLKKIHLHSHLVADIEGHGHIKHVYIFSVTALFVLLIACINFMNLTTAQGARRAKEVGMRKISGARRARIMKQFLGESIFISFLSQVIAMGLVFLTLPGFNNLTGKTLSLSAPNSIMVLIPLIVIAVFTGIIAGSYPAFHLSSFQPLDILSRQRRGPKSMLFRRILVVFQFSVSILLITATLIVHKQLNYIQNSELGFEREHVVCIKLRGESPKYYAALKDELLKNPQIKSVTASNQLPTNVMISLTGADWPGKDPEADPALKLLAIDYDFIQTLNVRMAAGRAFSKEFPSDRTEAFILNEKAAALTGMDSPIGNPFSFYGREGQIIGVVKNFHIDNFHSEIEPLILFVHPPSSDYFVLARISGAETSQSLRRIENAWNKTVPAYPFEFSFLDEEFDRQYRSEQKMGRLFNGFTFLSIFIASLGLFGLASFLSHQRTKEIGIRRVVGASILDIVKLLSREFLWLVAGANVLAWPASYFIMNKWLNNFAYRTHIQIWIFLLAALAAFGVAVLSVGLKTLKAAAADPVVSLRYE